MKDKFILLTFLILFSLIFTPIIKDNSVVMSLNSEFKSYQVQKGDSLWGIALIHNKFDIEKFIIETKKLNKLLDSAIYEDQILIIP